MGPHPLLAHLAFELLSTELSTFAWASGQGQKGETLRRVLVTDTGDEKAVKSYWYIEELCPSTFLVEHDHLTLLSMDRSTFLMLASCSCNSMFSFVAGHSSVDA